MVDRETTWMMSALNQWLNAPVDSITCPPELDPDRLGRLLEENRLSPLFHRMSISFPLTMDWVSLRERLSDTYQRSLLQGLRQLKAGQDLMEILVNAGIKSLSIRGPFLAEDVYGDPALRLSSDIDVLVACRDRRRAWKACQAAGYRSLDWECPLWPVDQHRIHWRLQRAGDPVVCELHWAVEPVYGVMTLDYEMLVNDPTPTRQFLLLCLHAGEHVFERFGGASRPALEEALAQGMLFRWIDVVMFMQKYAAQLDWAEIERHARDRRAGARLALCLSGVRDWFNRPLPEQIEGFLEKWGDPAEIQPATSLRRLLEAWWERRARHAVGMETSLPDVLYYIWPQASFFVSDNGFLLALKRVGHGLIALGVLLEATMIYSCFAAITSVRRHRQGRSLAAERSCPQ